MQKECVMPRPSEAVRQKVLRETRQRLLDAAAAEFAREGFAAANVNHISQAAGFAKGTIYNYFPSKRALMLALIDEIASAQTEFIVQHVGMEEDPTQRLKRFVSAGFAFVQDHAPQAQVMITVVYGPDDEFKQHVYEAYDKLFAAIMEDIVGYGVARGDFRPVDPGVTAALLMATYLGSCSQLDSDGKIWLDPDQVAAFVLEGLRQRSDHAAGEG
jgi:AcrR family transcriptional regulator